eukprot:1764321-Prymnesium_polylepis.1
MRTIATLASTARACGARRDSGGTWRTTLDSSTKSENALVGGVRLPPLVQLTRVLTPSGRGKVPTELCRCLHCATLCPHDGTGSNWTADAAPKASDAASPFAGSLAASFVPLHRSQRGSSPGKGVGKGAGKGAGKSSKGVGKTAGTSGGKRNGKVGARLDSTLLTARRQRT